MTSEIRAITIWQPWASLLGTPERYTRKPYFRSSSSSGSKGSPLYPFPGYALRPEYALCPEYAL